jgi:hypothetical protein
MCSPPVFLTEHIKNPHTAPVSSTKEQNAWWVVNGAKLARKILEDPEKIRLQHMGGTIDNTTQFSHEAFCNRTLRAVLDLMFDGQRQGH